jgi:hypothetical protein
LRAVDGPQGELPITRKPKADPVSMEVILAKRTFSEAIRLAVNVCGLEKKEIYIPLKIDAGHWTRIMDGDGHFPVDKLNLFCDLVQNEIVLTWWAHSRGKGLHMLETEAERLLRESEESRAKVEHENRLLRELLQGKR